jgi:hypothetical protein
MALNAPKAFSSDPSNFFLGNPDALQNFLFSGSEAAGGAAGAGGWAKSVRAKIPPPEVKARNTYQKIVQPGGGSAGDQLETMEEFDRAAPYLAEEARTNPVQAQQTEGPFKGQRLGVMNYRQNAQAAGKKLWDAKIQPLVDNYGQVPIDHASVAADIKGTINNASPTDAARASAVQDLAGFYDEPTTVAQAMDKVKALNGDRAVVAYEKATPDKQAEMVAANPDLEAKLKAATSLREQTFNAIQQYGTPEEANYIREARKDYGALQGVAQKLGSANVPTPASLRARLWNGFHVAINPFGAHAYTNTNALDTVFRLSEPNRLAAVSSESLGRSALNPRSVPAVRTSPWTPPTPQYSEAIGPYHVPDVESGPRGQLPPLGFGAAFNPLFDREINAAPQPLWETLPPSPEEIFTPSLPSYAEGFRNIPETMRRNLPASLRMLPPKRR